MQPLFFFVVLVYRDKSLKCTTSVSFSASIYTLVYHANAIWHNVLSSDRNMNQITFCWLSIVLFIYILFWNMPLSPTPTYIETVLHLKMINVFSAPGGSMISLCWMLCSLFNAPYHAPLYAPLLISRGIYEIPLVAGRGISCYHMYQSGN